MATPRIVDRHTIPATATWAPILPPDMDVPEAPVVAWTDDGRFVADGADVDGLRVAAATFATELEGDYEELDEGVLAWNACELMLDPAFLRAMQDPFPIMLAGVPRRGRLLVGGMGSGIVGCETFVARVAQEYRDAPPAERVSGVALVVRDGAVTGMMNVFGLVALRKMAAGE